MDQNRQQDMRTEEINQELLAFFKALADSSRLKIAGMLAEQPYTLEELAAASGLSVSATSNHLSKLAKAGLVAERPDGHTYQYTLQTERLRSMAQRCQGTGTTPRFSEEPDLDAFKRKVLKAYTDAQGRITALPAQEKKLFVILRYAVKAFEPGKRYTEKQVNETLLRFNDDTASLRRMLVDHQFMARLSAGSEYWLTGHA